MDQNLTRFRDVSGGAKTLRPWHIANRRLKTSGVFYRYIIGLCGAEVSGEPTKTKVTNAKKVVGVRCSRCDSLLKETYRPAVAQEVRHQSGFHVGMKVRTADIPLLPLGTVLLTHRVSRDEGSQIYDTVALERGMLHDGVELWRPPQSAVFLVYTLPRSGDDYFDTDSRGKGSPL